MSKGKGSCSYVVSEREIRALEVTLMEPAAADQNVRRLISHGGAGDTIGNTEIPDGSFLVVDLNTNQSVTLPLTEYEDTITLVTLISGLFEIPRPGQVLTYTDKGPGGETVLARTITHLQC